MSGEPPPARERIGALPPGSCGIEGPVVVALAVVLDGAHILLSRRRPGEHLEGMWEFPGGKVREKERADEAARRELLEEVGLDLPVESFEPFTFVHHDYGDRRVLLLVFLARAEGTRLVWERTNLTAEGEKRPSGVSPGSLETRWVSLSELAGRPVTVTEMAPLVAARFEQIFGRHLVPAPLDAVADVLTAGRAGR